jgi:hypothetical protein
LDDKEPLALVRVNATERADMIIHFARSSRFGVIAPVERMGRHVYNLMIGDNKDVEMALSGMMTNHRLELTTQAEWESFAAFELFPVLKLAVAH